ncbi:MAG TPA: ABC transporter permease [Acidimicrobiales bacterium]|jgi:simple sugar transport system permease protein|nr:ABC transporter permease [Acidimicrobiales bacterium]
MIRRITMALAAPVLAIAFAMAVSAIMLALTDYSATEVFRVIFDDGFSRTNLVTTVNRAAPYYISGVAVAIGFKMNLFNIGVEGQYKLAALFAAAAAAAVELPAPLHVLFTLLVAMLVGAAWASIPALLKAYRGVSEVISSIMLNATALGVGAFFIQRWLRAPATESPVLGTRTISPSGQLPSLNGLLGVIGIDVPDATRVQSYVVVAAIVGVAYYLLIWRSRYGFDLRATGSNAEAATASGVNSKRMIITAMLISGAVAGLIGMNNIMGPAARYTDVSVVTGLGFTGIAIALLGRNNPVGIAFAALLWAFMDAVQTPLSNANLPKQITSIMQGITVLSVVIAYEVVRRISARQELAGLRREVTAGGAAPPPADPPSPTGSGPEVAPA